MKVKHLIQVLGSADPDGDVSIVVMNGMTGLRSDKLMRVGHVRDSVGDRVTLRFENAEEIGDE